MTNDELLWKVENLKVWFPLRRSIFRGLFSGKGKYARAVDGVSFEIRKGEVFGLAGESGCGKTTTGKSLLRLVEPTEGRILFEGIDMRSLNKRDLRKLRQKMQIVYQDPYESLDPKQYVRDIIEEPLQIFRLAKGAKETRRLVQKALSDVGLVPPKEFLWKYPHELSGGQRQSVAIASSLVLSPSFLVLDEPVSMLDATARIQIMKLLVQLKNTKNLTYLFITHDLSLAWVICDRIAIMYLGKILELGTVEDVIRMPKHPYTQALISSVTILDPTYEYDRTALKERISSVTNIPSGCRFHPQCIRSTKICAIEEPKLVHVNKGHVVACHLVG